MYLYTVYEGNSMESIKESLMTNFKAHFYMQNAVFKSRIVCLSMSTYVLWLFHLDTF